MKTFKPTSEQIQQLTISKKAKEYIEDDSISLLVYCLQKPKEEELNKLRQFLYFLQKHLEWSINNDIVQEVQNEGVFYFNSWEYDGAVCETEEEYNDLMGDFVKRLAILAFVVPTPDYFNNGDLFQEKIEDIESVLDDFKETVLLEYRKQLCKQFKDCEVVNKED